MAMSTGEKEWNCMGKEGSLRVFTVWKRLWSLHPGRSKTELAMALEILVSLALLEEGLKHLLSRVLAKLNELVTVFAGWIESPGGAES